MSGSNGGDNGNLIAAAVVAGALVNNLPIGNAIVQGSDYLVLSQEGTTDVRRVSVAALAAAIGSAGTVTAPVNAVLPQLTGSTALGSTLVATPGVWSGAPTPAFTYQITRDGSPRAAATTLANLDRQVTSADAGAALRLVEIAVNSAGTGAAISGALNVPSAGTPPVNTVLPAVSGLTALGDVLTATAGTWTGTAPITYTYQWQRDGVNIGGATAATRVIAAADQGAALRCVVTATNAAGSASATSAAVSVPAAAVAPGALQSFSAVATSSAGIQTSGTAPATGTGPFTYDRRHVATAGMTGTALTNALNAAPITSDLPLSSIITGLAPPETNFTVEVRAVGPTGLAGPWARTTATTLAASGGGEPEPSTLPTTFQLTNEESSPSAGFKRMGVAFKAGDVPTGSTPVIKRGGATIAANFNARALHSDGSLQFAVATLRDDQAAATSSRDYALEVAAGSYNDTGSLTISQVLGTTDFNVLFTSVTDTTDGTNFTQVGSGSYLASLNTQIAVATRRERYESGAVCESWTCWGMARDVSGNAEHAHLKTNWYISVWKDAGGAVVNREIAAEPALDWWSVANKKRMHYTVALRNGATVIETYANVDHHYRSRWITCIKTGVNRGRRFWTDAAGNVVAPPTLTYRFNKRYWRSTGITAPYDPDLIPNAHPGTFSATYVPGSSQDNRADIDIPGGYQGRGTNTNMDVIAWMRQGAADYATMRVSAMAGLHVFFHYRANQTRTRPSESADVANTPLSLKMEVGNGPAVAYNFTADGMPAPGNFYADLRNDPADQDGYVAPQGGNAHGWGHNGESSHAVNYCGMAYLLEGERFHLEALIDLGTNGVHQGLYNEYGSRPFSLVRYLSGGTSGGQWDAVIDTLSQLRSIGFAGHLGAQAAAVTPANHVAKNYLKRLFKQMGMFLQNTLDHMPADVKAAGIHMADAQLAGSAYAYWMHNVSAYCLLQAGAISGEPGIVAYAAHMAKRPIRTVEQGMYATSYVVGANRWKETDWDATTNPFKLDSLAREEALVSGANDTVSVVLNPEGGNPYGMSVPLVITAGDKVRFGGLPGGLTGTLSLDTVYYARDVSANTFKVALTPGGTAINMPADGSVTALLDLQMIDANPVSVNPPHLVGADGYPAMAAAAVVLAHRQGVPGATQALVDKAELYMSSRDGKLGWATWAVVDDPAAAVKPDAFTAASAGTAATDGITVTFTPASTGGTPTGGTWERLISGTTYTAPVEFTGLSVKLLGPAAETAYTFRVKSKNSAGVSDDYFTLTRTTAAEDTPPPSGTPWATDFATDEGKLTLSGAASITNGGLRMPGTTGDNDQAISTSPFTLPDGGRVAVEMTGFTGTASWIFGLRDYVDTNQQVIFIWHSGTLHLQAGNSPSATTTYDATTMRHLSLRRSGSDLVLETSPTGLDGSWAEQATLATSFGWTSMSNYILRGPGGSDVLIFDNLR